MAAISLFWYTNMAAVTSDENDLYIIHILIKFLFKRWFLQGVPKTPQNH